MRGRLIPLVLLALVTVPAVVVAQPYDAAQEAVQEICVDAGALPHYPTGLVTFDGDCTDPFVDYDVNYRQTNGAYRFTVYVKVASATVQLVLECTSPENLPSFGWPPGRPGERPAPCWNPAWSA